MQILMINGSHRENGNTQTVLELLAAELQEHSSQPKNRIN